MPKLKRRIALGVGNCELGIDAGTFQDPAGVSAIAHVICKFTIVFGDDCLDERCSTMASSVSIMPAPLITTGELPGFDASPSSIFGDAWPSSLVGY
jgi:hypothetical protein